MPNWHQPSSLGLYCQSTWTIISAIVMGVSFTTLNPRLWWSGMFLSQVLDWPNNILWIYWSWAPEGSFRVPHRPKSPSSSSLYGNTTIQSILECSWVDVPTQVGNRNRKIASLQRYILDARVYLMFWKTSWSLQNSYVECQWDSKELLGYPRWWCCLYAVVPWSTSLFHGPPTRWHGSAQGNSGQVQPTINELWLKSDVCYGIPTSICTPGTTGENRHVV